MGSATYEWMLRHVVGPQAKRPEPWPYKQPAWVFSSRPRSPIPGADIRFVSGDVDRCTGRWSWQRPEDVWIVGGGELAGQFYDHGLLDEMFVQVGSVTLGRKAAVARPSSVHLSVSYP